MTALRKCYIDIFIYICLPYVCVYIYPIYYSVIKKNEVLPFAATWMDSEILYIEK